MNNDYQYGHISNSFKLLNKIISMSESVTDGGTLLTTSMGLIENDFEDKQLTVNLNYLKQAEIVNSNYLKQAELPEEIPTHKVARKAKLFVFVFLGVVIIGIGLYLWIPNAQHEEL